LAAVRSDRVTVVGAGIGGLVAALDLALAGVEVTVVERAGGPGGKLREVEVAGRRLDAGPTVFTLRGVFEEIFADAGTTLEERLALTPLDVLARHAWGPGERLDLHADRARSAEAIAAFSGVAEARRYLAFSDRARAVFETLEASFIRASRPSPAGLVARVGLAALDELWRIRPFTTLWRALGRHFRDPRLRQLFARYATYCGSSPFLAPATLMLVAHVEQSGVWRIAGGMTRLARALEALAREHGAVFRYCAEAQELVIGAGRMQGVRLATGELLGADAVVVNADPSALAGGRLGAPAARAVAALPRAARSLSALTFALVAELRGFPLAHHTVFFSADYAAEFDDLLARSRLPREPTVYVCAEDRDEAEPRPAADERLLLIVNAPPIGDVRPFHPTELAQCETRTFAVLERAGLTVITRPERMVKTTPADFERLFPGTGGALYGPASHGWQASFRRPGARTRVPGLYLAGGGTHPGPGVPMAALSGRLAAASLIADLASTRRSRTAATCGGTLTR